MREADNAALLFTRMVNSGDRLVEAQRLEESLGKLCSKRGTPENLERWKESRRWVEAFAEEYSTAVREWRENVESQLMEQAAQPLGPVGPLGAPA